PAARRLDLLAADYLVQGVVGALCQHVGQQFGNQLARGVLLEDGHRIHAAERRDQQSPVLGGHERPARALEPAYRIVGVDSDDERVAQGPRLVQVLDVAAVQQVEATVGEHQPARPGPAEAPHELLAAKDLHGWRRAWFRGVTHGAPGSTTGACHAAWSSRTIASPPRRSNSSARPVPMASASEAGPSLSARSSEPPSS